MMSPHFGKVGNIQFSPILKKTQEILADIQTGRREGMGDRDYQMTKNKVPALSKPRQPQPNLTNTTRPTTQQYHFTTNLYRDTIWTKTPGTPIRGLNTLGSLWSVGWEAFLHSPLLQFQKFQQSHAHTIAANMQTHRSSFRDPGVLVACSHIYGLQTLQY